MVDPLQDQVLADPGLLGDSFTAGRCRTFDQQRLSRLQAHCAELLGIRATDTFDLIHSAHPILLRCRGNPVRDYSDRATWFVSPPARAPSARCRAGSAVD